MVWFSMVAAAPRRVRARVVLGWVVAALVADSVDGGASAVIGCKEQNFCSGHGTCTASTTTGKSCACYDSWGSASDPVQPSPDCSLRTCPTGTAHAALPTSNTRGHNHTECSSAGVCDRRTGACKCLHGRGGRACEVQRCPNDCSGHGSCLSMKQLAMNDEALPLTNRTTVKYQFAKSEEAWDTNAGHACVCDSSWSVGLESGEYQEPEWFGADCSQRQCPSGDDPMTSANELSCKNATATGGRGEGEEGNLCIVPCSNRGICNHTDGACACFPGFKGLACGTADAHVGRVEVEKLFLVPETEWTG